MVAAVAALSVLAVVVTLVVRSVAMAVEVVVWVLVVGLKACAPQPLARGSLVFVAPAGAIPSFSSS
jgi:hypothetical protein